MAENAITKPFGEISTPLHVTVLVYNYNTSHSHNMIFFLFIIYLLFFFNFKTTAPLHYYSTYIPTQFYSVQTAIYVYCMLYGAIALLENWQCTIVQKPCFFKKYRALASAPPIILIYKQHYWKNSLKYFWDCCVGKFKKKLHIPSLHTKTHDLFWADLTKSHQKDLFWADLTKSHQQKGAFWG